VIPHDRCPQCAALIRPEQAWCSLCHADLRPQPEPIELPVEHAMAVDPAADSGSAAADPRSSELEDLIALQFTSGSDPSQWGPVHEPSAAERGRHSGRHASSTNGSTLSGNGSAAAAAALASLNGATGQAQSSPASTPLRDLPEGVDVDGMLRLLASSDNTKIDGLLHRLDGKSNRVMIITGATVLLTAIVVAGMFIIGSFVH
jgi:hypothetical protein